MITLGSPHHRNALGAQLPDPRAASSAFLTAGTFPDPPQRVDAPGDRFTPGGEAALAVGRKLS